MNGAEMLDRLANADPKLLAKPSAIDQAELETLRAFYKAWELLHEIPNDKMHRKQKEEAAERLVQQAHILRRMNV